MGSLASRVRGLAARRWVPVATLLSLGAVERTAWNLLRPDFGAAGEAMNVALAVASGRGFADAYRAGQGPTAHLLPVSPGIAGAVYYLFGRETTLAELALSAWSIGLALGTYALLYRAFGYLRVPRTVRLAGLACGCLAPTYVSQEAVDFRVWEGGLAIFLTALFLERLLAARNLPVADAREGEYRRGALLGVCAATLLFVNPLLGVACLGCLAAFALRYFSIRQTAVTAGSVLLIAAITIAPWAVRNATTLHAPVLLRSNAGLELALTNYPGSLKQSDEQGEFLRRLTEIHPTMSPEAFQAMQRQGEVAYFDTLGRAAMRWIVEHPLDAAQLWLHHAREMVVPSAWKFDVGGTSRTGWLKAILAQLVGIGGLAGMAVVFSLRPGRGAIYPAMVVALTVLAVSPFQPVVRYTYLIYPIMVFFAAALLMLVTPARPAPH